MRERISSMLRSLSGQQVIDDDDAACAFGKQAAYDGGADEARASGDDVVAHD